jgi:hypothetical protein
MTSPPVFTYQQNAGVATSTGKFSLFPVGVGVWQKSASPVRPIINGTINGAGCSSAPPIAMELSGGFLLFTASTPNGSTLAFRSET